MVFPLAGMRILIVDDEPDTLEVMKLNLSGYIRQRWIAVSNVVECGGYCECWDGPSIDRKIVTAPRVHQLAGVIPLDRKSPSQ
jgi:CheY-like chemotaxis protein